MRRRIAILAGAAVLSHRGPARGRQLGPRDILPPAAILASPAGETKPVDANHCLPASQGPRHLLVCRRSLVLGTRPRITRPLPVSPKTWLVGPAGRIALADQTGKWTWRIHWLAPQGESRQASVPGPLRWLHADAQGRLWLYSRGCLARLPPKQPKPRVGPCFEPKGWGAAPPSNTDNLQPGRSRRRLAHLRGGAADLPDGGLLAVLVPKGLLVRLDASGRLLWKRRLQSKKAARPILVTSNLSAVLMPGQGSSSRLALHDLAGRLVSTYSLPGVPAAIEPFRTQPGFVAATTDVLVTFDGKGEPLRSLALGQQDAPPSLSVGARDRLALGTLRWAAVLTRDLSPVWHVRVNSNPPWSPLLVAPLSDGTLLVVSDGRPWRAYPPLWLTPRLMLTQ